MQSEKNNVSFADQQPRFSPKLEFNRKNYLITGFLNLPIITLGIYSDFYLQKDPENFFKSVISTFNLTQNLELSYRINSALLSVGSDVAMPVCAFLSLYTLTTFTTDTVGKIFPQAGKNNSITEAENKIYFNASIVAACLVSFYFILLEFKKNNGNSGIDQGDLLAFSVPIITTLIYIITLYSKEIEKHWSSKIK